VCNSLKGRYTWGAEKYGNNYSILNIPFFASNIACGDTVKVENDDGALYFDGLIEESVPYQ